MIRRWVILVGLVPLLASAQSGSEVKNYPEAAGCIGGDKCGHEQALRVELESRPVIGIRFHADDDIGSSTKGKLRLRIDDALIEESLDIPSEGKNFRLEVESLRGRMLVFEPAADDEVRVRNIEVIYAIGGTWKDYSRYDSCIGGQRCRHRRIRIPLESRPVTGLRFQAHDDVGASTSGELRVRIDDRDVQSAIDVKSDGKRHEIAVPSIAGREMVIEATTDDEVEVQAIEIRYGEGIRIRPVPGLYAPGGLPPVTERGGCIGGSKCGGAERTIRVALERRPVRSIRFRAHDDVGSRTEGHLRVRVDDVLLENALDVPRAGKSFTVEGGGARGQYLVLEAGDDEVVVEDLEVRYGK